MIKSLFPDCAHTDYELEIIANLLAEAHQNRFCFGELSIINLYVAIKSKPMMILFGPRGSGKTEAVQCLSNILLADPERCQFLVGHPWTFRKSENLVMFTEVYTRFNTEKLLWLIEESWQPKNVQKVFIACLTHISPGELLSFFTEVAFQLRHGQLMKIGDIHFNEPIPFPPNIYLIETMDNPQYRWQDGNLMAQTTLIDWPTIGPLSGIPMKRSPSSSWESAFLRSRVRYKPFAYRKIHSILKPIQQPLMPLVKIGSLMNVSGIPTPIKLVDDVMIYLANSWSQNGNGLFNPSITRNLQVALDLAIVQIILPQVEDAIQENKTLQEQLFSIVDGKFPRSTVYLQTHREQALAFR